MTSVNLPDELAAELSEAAARRGMRVDEFAARLVAAGLASPEVDPLEAFIGCGASGRHEPFDIHRARRDLAKNVTPNSI